MKKSMLIACTLMLCTFSLFAQTGKTPVKETIVFAKTFHDYGTIIQGADGNCEFKFTNKGKEPLVQPHEEVCLSGQKNLLRQVNQVQSK